MPALNHQSFLRSNRGSLVLCILGLVTAILFVLCVLGLVAVILFVTSYSKGPKEWEYESETIRYDDVCATTAIEGYSETETVKLAVQMGGYSYNTIVNIWQIEKCYTPVLPDGALEEILATYATCADEFTDDYMARMGSQGWEVVSPDKLEYTDPGSGLCPGLTVDYGLEVTWKRPK